MNLFLAYMHVIHKHKWEKNVIHGNRSSTQQPCADSNTSDTEILSYCCNCEMIPSLCKGRVTDDNHLRMFSYTSESLVVYLQHLDILWTLSRLLHHERQHSLFNAAVGLWHCAYQDIVKIFDMAGSSIQCCHNLWWQSFCVYSMYMAEEYNGFAAQKNWVHLLE